MKNEIQSKFENINTRLNQTESNLESNITEQVNKSILSVKDSIVTALRDDNKMLQGKVEFLGKKVAESEQSFNRLNQYNRRNNLEIQGIPSTVGDEVLEDKLKFLNVQMSRLQKVTDDCHRLGKSNSKNAFFDRKNCLATLSKKLDLQHIDKVKLGFPEANLFFNENLTPYNQKLTWKCRELKRARKIHSTWSTKGVIKLRRTMNKHAIFIEDEIELSDLCLDFVFRETQRQVRK